MKDNFSYVKQKMYLNLKVLSGFNKFIYQIW